MKVFVQRVREKTSIHSRSSDFSESSSFEGPGLVVLLGWEKQDEFDLDALEVREKWILEHVRGLRIFPDRADKMNLNLADYMAQESLEEGGILWVPQFTLAAELKSGFRPSFTKAMDPKFAKERFEALKAKCLLEKPVYKQLFGVFAADMELRFLNWGPVSIPL